MGNLTYVTQVRTCPFGVGIASGERRRGPGTEMGLYRTNQELGSTVSLQVTTAWVRHLVQPVACQTLWLRVVNIFVGLDWS